MLFPEEQSPWVLRHSMCHLIRMTCVLSSSVWAYKTYCGISIEEIMDLYTFQYRTGAHVLIKYACLTERRVVSVVWLYWSSSSIIISSSSSSGGGGSSSSSSRSRRRRRRGGGGIGVLRPFSTIYAIQVIIFTHLACIKEINERQKIGYRETWNSTTVTLVLWRARSTAPIHGIAILRPHPTGEARKIVITPGVIAGTRTRHPEFLSLRLYHWAIADP